MADLPGVRRAAFRELQQWMLAAPAPRAVLLSGERQIGETTLLLQAADALLRSGVPAADILYATFDHPILKLAGIDAVSDTRQLQREYWEALNIVLNELKGQVPGNRKPQPAQWINYAIGRTHFQLAAVMNRPNKLVRAELYLSGPNAKPHFHLLHAQREQVERELGYALTWDELPDGGDSRISITLPDADVHERADWTRQLRWMAQRLNDLHRVFSQRVRSLRADDWRPAVHPEGND